MCTRLSSLSALGCIKSGSKRHISLCLIPNLHSDIFQCKGWILIALIGVLTLAVQNVFL